MKMNLQSRLSILLAALAFVCLAFTEMPLAQETRDIVLSQDTDFFGGDYKTEQDISLDECVRSCIADSTCKAFTYNSNANWCFLKNSVGEAQSFDGAVGGKIVLRQAETQDDRDRRRAALEFLPKSYIDHANRLAGTIEQRERTNDPASQLLDAARTAQDEKDVPGVSENYQQALRNAPNETALWARFSRALLSTNTDNWELKSRATSDSIGAAINALLRSDDTDIRGEAFAMLAVAMEREYQWKAAIKAYRASLEAREMGWVREALDKVEAERGFRITEHQIDSDAVSPRACVVFSDPIAIARIRAGDFVQIEGVGDVATTAEDRQICIDGVRHGERYRVTVRAGLPARDGETLKNSADLNLYVRDRSPSVRFPGRAYILPKGGTPSLPVVTVNTDTISAEVVRIGDRSLARTMGDGSFLKQLTGYDFADVRSSRGEPIWKGSVSVRRELNRDVTTAIPLADIAAEMKPGVYIMTASAANGPRPNEWNPSATQWFIVTDIGLTTFAGPRGLDVFARSFSTLKPIAGANVRLVARNDEILGAATTGGDGRAQFDPGLLKGSDGNAPALVVIEAEDGDYAFLDYTAGAFDLTDRGVTGRPAPKALDVFATTDRGVYRPGENVAITALSRNAKAEAIGGTPLTMIVKRPDGQEAFRETAPDLGQGGHHLTVPLSQAAMRGQWRAGFHTDPEAPPLAEVSFLVEEFQPERLDFELESTASALKAENPQPINLKARFLYGLDAANLRVEGETRITSTPELAGFPKFHFGRADDGFDPLYQPIDDGQSTAEDGSAAIVPALPELPDTTVPMLAKTHIRVVDPGGRPVERTIEQPVATDRLRLGIKPLFDRAIEEGGNARFEIIAIDAQGKRIALEQVGWTLNKRDTQFQWYSNGGSWNYEPFVTTRRIASGTLDVSADGAARLESAIEWGEYELVLDGNGDALDASFVFNAGWYVSPKSEETPDVLRVSLDKQTYQVGDEARVHLTPRFAGTALVMVADDRLIDMQTIEVPEGGAEVTLPVTAEWGPGAYVTAVLYRAMDLDQKRMPGRALGLQWASVDPAERALDVSIDAADVSRPRTALTTKIRIANLPAGEEAHITLAATDVGILNITDHPAPDADGYYFGQRRLGLEIRDVYGRLIDRMQGAPGKVRSGGDGQLSRFDVPPPTDTLVAFHSGVVRVDDNGEVEIEFAMPDFNGTVRLAAMAWSAKGVGHAIRDVVVRDPIAVSVSTPLFLAPGDQSRIALDLAHVEGATGQISVFAEGDGVDLGDDNQRTVELAEQQRTQILLPVTAVAPGNHTISIHVSPPEGKEIIKTISLPVRANDLPVMRVARSEIQAGGSLTLDGGLLDGLMPGSTSVSVSIGSADGIDVPGLVAMLDRYPYGCTEQLTSRALPLVYLDDVTRNAGLPGDANAVERVAEAIPLVLAHQASNGGFTLWGHGSAEDLWLDAYVTEFLSRAREKGFHIPDVAFSSAIDNLRNRLAYAPDFDSGGEDIAYALYVLARNGRAAIGDLRYYAETRLDAFSTPMAKAQLAAALSLYGDNTRAARTMRTAIRSLSDDGTDEGWRSDYGSSVRDRAAVLALAAESELPGIELAALTKDTGAAFSARKYTSTQEQVWMTLAAHAVQKNTPPLSLEVAGSAVTGRFGRTFDGSELVDSPVAVSNTGEGTAHVHIRASGVPLEPPAAQANGYAISRSYFDLEGNPASPDQVALGTRLVTLLTITSSQSRAARLIVNDPLPAGFEIDNPSLMSGGEIANLPAFSFVDNAANSEFRSDRFVTAIDRTGSDETEFTVGYIVRAVSPGTFAHPAAIVEDMYRPEFRGRTDTSRIEIVGPRR